MSNSAECDGTWKNVCIDDAQFSIRAVKTDDIWKILLTNLVEIWTEVLDERAIFQRCETLNPSLSIDDVDVHEFVSRLLVEIPRYATGITVDRIELSTELEGGIFRFAVELTKGSARQLWEEVAMPMCLAAGELRRRHAILLNLVEAKDAEITEYKLNGAELIRKHIETKPFSSDLFGEDAPTLNVSDCHFAFREIMKVREELRIEISPIETEKTEACSAATTDTPEAKVIIEEEKNSRLREIDSLTDNGATSRVEGKSTSVVQQSDTISPKMETEKNRDAQKRTRSPRSLSAKRVKKTIHDFIT